MRIFVAFFLSLITIAGTAQNKTATISGKIFDEDDNPLSKVSIIILGRNTGIMSSDSGTFTIKVAAQKAIALTFSYSGYLAQQKNFYLSSDETETITIRMLRDGKTMDEVVIKNEKENNEIGLIQLNPKNAIMVPSTTGGVEAMIKTLVGSNNEISSQYNVRGGNYDENLIYINDFEVFRPYLVRSGQQEGLSLINPELAKNINFYIGGFQAKYGDKMSSVLDIQYKKPTKFGGSAYLSFMEQGLELEGSSKDGKVTWLAAVRNKDNRNILSSQPIQGAYIPSSSDAQTYITYQLSKKLQLELTGIYSTSKFTFYPESVEKTASVFTPLYSANIGLDIYFEGQEKDQYKTSLIGASLVHTPTDKLKLKWMFSHFKDNEKENFDIASAYIFGERDFDSNSGSFGQIVNPLGAGAYQNYARNELDIDVWNASLKGSYMKGNHFFQFGNTIDRTIIKDQLYEWEYIDSTGYSIPYNTSTLNLFKSINSNTDLTVQKYYGYLQDNLHFTKAKNDITLQVGIRYNYNNLNNELLISPRVQASWKPGWKNDFIFRLSGGMYDQPPFYRELRAYDGTLNTDIKAQRSLQFVAGMDYNFIGLGDRPFRFTTEAYYKNMSNVVPYDVDNVKIRYYGNNDAKAYSTGIDMRLFGEIVAGTQSWLTVGIMQARENLENDYYTEYTNADGEIIKPGTPDQIPVDSVQTSVEWLRRPSDRLITVGLFLEDYLSTNKNFKVYLSLIYGSNMPYNIPNNARYRNALIIEPYIRADIGFSVLLLSAKSSRRSHNPFRGFDNIWASLEILNLINRENTISFQMVEDFSNNAYAIPNRLTPRLINFKILGRF